MGCIVESERVRAAVRVTVAVRVAVAVRVTVTVRVSHSSFHPFIRSSP